MKNKRDQNGEKNPNTKLDWAKVDEIRERYKNGETNITALAKRYSVCQKTINHILLNITWHVSHLS